MQIRGTRLIAHPTVMSLICAFQETSLYINVIIEYIYVINKRNRNIIEKGITKTSLGFNGKH